MRPSCRTFLALLALSTLAIAGCQSSTNPSSAPTSVRGSAPTVTSHPATSTSPTATTTPATTPPTQQAWPTRPRATRGTSGLLVAIRSARHPGYDRVVFEFRGGPPPATVRYEPYLLEDPRGGVLPLQGRAYLAVVFRNSGTVDQNAPGSPRTYTGPSVITTGYPSLTQVRLAGDFEAVLSFGLGLERRVGFRVLTLTDPPRVAIDVAYQAAPAVFPGIWPFSSQQQARDAQRAVADGHQPWLLDPRSVVSSFASSALSVERPSVSRIDPATYRVTGSGMPDVLRVEVAQPVVHGTGGIWMVTRVVRVA
jgi:hypothetical protein